MSQLNSYIDELKDKVSLYKLAFKISCQEFFNTASGGFENVDSMETRFLAKAEKETYKPKNEEEDEL